MSKDPLTHKIVGFYIQWCVTSASEVSTAAKFLFLMGRKDLCRYNVPEDCCLQGRDAMYCVLYQCFKETYSH